MKNYISLLCVFYMLNLLGISARANMQFNEQSRYVSASNNRGSSQTIPSPDFGVFDETASVTYTASSGLPYTCEAFQDSELLPDHITFDSGAKSWDQFYHNGTDELLKLSGISSFSIEFSVSESCNIFLTGSMKTRFDYGGSNNAWGYGDYSIAWLYLQRKDGAPIDGGDVILYQYSRDNNGLPDIKTFSEQRQLSEGIYIFSAEASISATYRFSEIYNSSCGGGGYANFNFDMIVTPEPASLLLLGLGGLLVRKK